MDEIESAHKKVIDILKSIKTVEEIAEKKDVIVKTYLDGLRSGLKSLESMVAESKPKNEVLVKYDKLKNSRKNMESDVNNELDKLQAQLNAENEVLNIKGELVGYTGPIVNDMNMIWMQMM